MVCVLHSLPQVGFKCLFMFFVAFMNQKITVVGIVKAQKIIKRQHFGVGGESVCGIEETPVTW